MIKLLLRGDAMKPETLENAINNQVELNDPQAALRLKWLLICNDVIVDDLIFDRTMIILAGRGELNT